MSGSAHSRSHSPSSSLSSAVVAVRNGDEVTTPPTTNATKQDGHTFWMWVAATSCLVSGVMCVLAVKLQSLNPAAIKTGELKSFTQPFWQTFIMFCGESICLFVWQYDERIVKAKKGRKHGIFELPTDAQLALRWTPTWWWSVPSILDLTGTTMVNAAFAMTYGSTVQMLRNSVLIMTSIVTLCMMRRPLRVHEWIGIILITGGMVAAGIMAVIHPDQNATIDSSKSWIGILLTLIGTIFNALQLIVEEKMFELTYSPPMAGVGIQGIMGVLLTIIVIIICHFAGFYNFAEGWYQMNHTPSIIGANLWYLVVVFIFNGSGLMTTFLGSGLLRGVMYSCRGPILFLVELCTKWQTYTWGGLLSLILTILGFMSYNYLIPFINKKHLPKTHRVLRAGIPCFCTKPLPASDDESVPLATTDKEAHLETTPSLVESVAKAV